MTWSITISSTFFKSSVELRTRAMSYNVPISSRLRCPSDSAVNAFLHADRRQASLPKRGKCFTNKPVNLRRSPALHLLMIYDYHTLNLASCKQLKKIYRQAARDPHHSADDPWAHRSSQHTRKILLIQRIFS